MRVRPQAMDRRVRKKLTVALVLTEIVRWICLLVPIFLSVWVYARKLGYHRFINGWNEIVQFWVIVSFIFLAGSLLIYLPMKLIYIKYFFDVRRLYGWRPSILMYMFLCALPCITLVAYANKTQMPPQPSMDAVSETVLQVVVFGLTLTEWMAKIREEVLSYDLITAMSVDFFFAYDVIETLLMPSMELKVFETGWFYVCMVAAWVAMAKYIPVQPTSITESDDPKPLVICLLVSMFCNDIPFVIIRVTTMALFGLRASDIIHPLKNIALICFSLAQLYIVFVNRSRRNKHKPKICEKRCSRKCDPIPSREASDLEMKANPDCGTDNAAYKQ